MAKEDDATTAGKGICILGPMSMQNQLLANFLAESTGVKCLTRESIEDHLSDGENGHVILWDCQGRTSKSILAEMQHYPLEGHVVLLFNLSRGAAIEKEAVNRGIRGFIYEHESFDKLPKAVRAVNKGELWLSRQFMSEWILATKDGYLQKSEDSGLTSKEAQILRFLADGASNRDIAEKLVISTNTAKTHVYNIFKKINVTSRLQAAMWARRNL